MHEAHAIIDYGKQDDILHSGKLYQIENISGGMLMEISSNKAGIARSTEENRTLSKALQAQDVSSSSASKPELKEGQQLKGIVLDLRYNEVKIQLEPGRQIITARITGEVPLAIGEEALFQVTEDSGNHLILKYLPENTAPADAVILKALTANGLPMTDRNKAILSELLKYRMPIDKQTLQTLLKASVTNREASPQSLVLMMKHSIPMTPSNIRQFEAYQNGTGKLITDIQNFTKALSELFVQTSEPEAVLQSTVLSTDQSLALSGLKTAAQTPAQISDQNAAQATAFNLLSDPLFQAPDEHQNLVLSLNDSLLQLLLKDQEVSTPAASRLTGGTEVFPPSAEAIPVLPEAIPVLPEAIQASVYPKPSDFLTDTEQINLGQLIRQLPEGSLFADRLISGGVTTADILKFISEQLPQAGSKAAKAMLQSPEYARLLTEAFHQRWTITPEKLQQKGSVSELYQRLQEDMEALSLLGKAEEKLIEGLKLQEPVQNLRENLNFLKDLNQIFTYLQLPVQTENQDIHSELYVFTNKKALKLKKDLSVLLHLDMPNLGAINIHVTLEHNIVNAKFYPEEKAAKAILTDNVPSLGEALQRKGYSLRYEVMEAYQKPDFVKDFIEQNAVENSPIRYSFDIRA